MRTSLLERALLVVAGLVMVYPRWIQDLVGLALVALVVALQVWRQRSAPAPVLAAVVSKDGTR